MTDIKTINLIMPIIFIDSAVMTDRKYTTPLKTILESTHTSIRNIIIVNNKCMEVTTVLKTRNRTFITDDITTDIKCMKVIAVLKTTTKSFIPNVNITDIK